MSFHYDIFPAGDVCFLGMTELITDDFGRYLGNRLVPVEIAQDKTEWEHSGLQTMQLAHQFSKKGYFGPLSIDAMRYDDAEGVCRERPLQDVNARYSMGRSEWEKQKKD